MCVLNWEVLFYLRKIDLGKNEKIFKLYKFRTMTDERDKDGELLPDSVRLTAFGKFLRATSLEVNDIIRQTTESLENKGFFTVSRG